MHEVGTYLSSRSQPLPGRLRADTPGRFRPIPKIASAATGNICPGSSVADAAVDAAKLTDYYHLPGWRSEGVWGAAGMRVGVIGGSVAGCATAALLHRVGHDVIVFERSGSDLVSRGAGIGTPTAVWQDMMARGLICETLPAFRIDYLRFVTRGSGTGQPRWLGDAQLQGSSMLLNWAHLYQWLRRGVPDELYRGASVVELIEVRPDGTTVHLRPGGSVDFDLVVCADGYRSIGRRLVDPDAALRYRGMVTWRGLLHESDLRADPLDGCDLLRVGYQGGHGVLYYIPGSGQSAEPGKRLLKWGY